MMLTISDPKTGKAYSVKADNAAVFMGRKIGEEATLDSIGLAGYSAKITGGSDKEGFPMKNDLRGTGRKKILKTVNKKKGIKIKITKRGCVVGDDIAQINLAVSKYGPDPIEGTVKVVEKGDEKSAKEIMVQKSLENVNKISAEEAKQAQLEMKKSKKQ